MFDWWLTWFREERCRQLWIYGVECKELFWQNDWDDSRADDDIRSLHGWRVSVSIWKGFVRDEFEKSSKIVIVIVIKMALEVVGTLRELSDEKFMIGSSKTR